MQKRTTDKEPFMLSRTQHRPSPAPTVFLALLAAIAVVTVLKVGQSIFLPITISIFLSFALRPLVHALQRWKIPITLASLISLAVVFAFLTLLGSLLSMSLASLNERLPFYLEKLRELTVQGIAWLEDWGIYVNRNEILKQINPNTVASLIGQSFLSMFNAVKYGFIVFFVTLFALIESGRLKNKVFSIYGEGSPFQKYFAEIGQDIQRYLFFKSLISLSTGILIWLFLKILGVDFPLVWGFLAFLLNFIPSIGSIVAGIPPLLLTLVQYEHPLSYFIAVLLGILTIQVTFGNFLEPRVMGRSLNMSALVIFISLVFWGWIWGPIGMLLAVPLTVSTKLAFGVFPRTQHLSKLMEG